ncbi:MAG: hypothetical protein Q8P81_04330 [Nanoarchaeota archaeon]|nr:hypothetical protein [Nanoarchaeota archaeon]
MKIGRIHMGVTDHVLDQYRERVTGDPLRNIRSKKNILGILISGLEGTVSFSDFESRALEGSIHYEKIDVDLHGRDGSLLGRHDLILGKQRYKGRRSWTIVTLYPLD